MSLRYENCESCFNKLQNITFCTNQKPLPTSQSFANEQTIEMIKILIGEWNGLQVHVGDEWLSPFVPIYFSTAVTFSKKLIRPRDFYPIDHLKRIQSGLMMGEFDQALIFQIARFDSSFFVFLRHFWWISIILSEFLRYFWQFWPFLIISDQIRNQNCRFHTIKLHV